MYPQLDSCNRDPAHHLETCGLKSGFSYSFLVLPTITNQYFFSHTFKNQSKQTWAGRMNSFNTIILVLRTVHCIFFTKAGYEIPFADFYIIKASPFIRKVLVRLSCSPTYSLFISIKNCLLTLPCMVNL